MTGPARHTGSARTTGLDLWLYQTLRVDLLGASILPWNEGLTNPYAATNGNNVTNTPQCACRLLAADSGV